MKYKHSDGPFLRLYLKALGDPGKNYVLIIDEINRGNLSKLLGELLYALEYRGRTVRLPYKNLEITVPKNLYIVATMNSSDRSIGHIDVATRRRFAVFHVPPDPKVVIKEWGDDDNGIGDKLANLMVRLNAELKNAGEGAGELGVGHSYFLPNEDVSDKVASVLIKINYQLIPLLREYHDMAPEVFTGKWSDKPFTTIEEFVKWGNEFLRSAS